MPSSVSRLTNSRVRAQWLRSGTYMLPQVHPSRHLDVGIRMLSSADREERDGQEDLSYCIAQGPEPKGRREKCGWSWSPGVRCSSGVRQETEKESRWVLYQTVAQPTNNPKQTLGTESSHVGSSSPCKPRKETGRGEPDMARKPGRSLLPTVPPSSGDYRAESC